MTLTSDEERELQTAIAQVTASRRGLEELQAVRAALEASRAGLGLRLEAREEPLRPKVAPKVKAKRRAAGKRARQARARARR